MSWQKEGRAVFDSGPVTFSSFIDLQSDKCWTSIPFIPSGGKGGILVTLPEWIPGQVEVETAVYVCLRDGLKSCRTEILPYVTKTPLYDLTAVSDFWIQFQGVYPCNYPFEGVMAAFSYQNRGETSLQLSRSKITLLDENNQLVQRQSPYVRLDNPTKWCGADQPPALSGEESMLLIIWKEPTTPPVGTLVQATVTFCPVQTRFIDLDCPSREYEFYISK
ncbi:MAG: hypothetical protein GY805_16450 [Chloroflexi bacterium]|nr:hypothetical protein [Chloroflexota bacterium]